MREEKLSFSIILRMGLSLLPILFGMPFAAMIWCSYNIAMSFIVIGPVTSVVSSLCAMCISMFFYGFYGEGAKIEGLFLALEAILCAGACIYTVNKRKDFFSGVWLATAGYLIPSVISLKTYAHNAGMSIADYLTKLPVEQLRENFALTNEQYALGLDTAVIEGLVGYIHSFVTMLVPSILVISSVIVGYAVMWTVCARMRSVMPEVRHSFSEILIPRVMIIVMAICITTFLFNINQTVNTITINVFTILLYLCFFAGLSMVDYFFRKAIKSAVLRVVIYLVAFMTASLFLVAGLIIAAMADSFLDFRKIRKRRQCCETEE